MENRRPYWQVAVSLLFSILATAAFIVIGIRLIGFLMPFVIGWIVASIATPLVNWLEKRMKIVKKLGSALIVILVLAAIILVSYFAVSRLVTEVTGLIRDFPDLYEQTETGLEKIGQTLSGVFVRLPEGIQNGWTSLVENLDDYMGNLMSKVSEPTVTAAGNAAKKVPYMLVSFIVMIMSAYFFIVQREDVIHWMKGIAPEAVTKRMAMVMDNLKYAVGGYFKAQFKIMGIVFLILLAGLGFLKIHYFVLIAFLIAFLDFLPFFGTGTAMIPWAVYEVFMGEYKVAAALLIIYVVTQAVRQLIQPKLVGDSVGLNPLVTLLLLYIGYRVGGVIWMILAVPVGMVIINMCQAGAFDYIFNDVEILVDLDSIGLYVLTDLFERLDNFIEAGLSVGMVLTYFVVKMPLVISQILPVIFLLSTVIQLCIMARSRELTALQAGGISLGVVANSMILCGIFWGGVQLGFSEYLGVAGERESARIWQEEVRKKNLAATVLKDVWFTDGDWIVSLGTLDPQAHGTGFSGYELSDDGLSIKRIVQASTFTAEPSHWALQNVRVYTPDTFTQEQEPDFVLPLRQDPETFRLVSTGTKPQQLPLWQLGDAISQLKSSGSNVEALRTAWHAKLAYAASILVMAFVATAIVSWKDNIYIAVTVALLCTFLYFAVYTLGTTLGQRGILHPFLAAWTANLIALFFAFWRLIPLLLRRE